MQQGRRPTELAGLLRRSLDDTRFQGKMVHVAPTFVFSALR